MQIQELWIIYLKGRVSRETFIAIDISELINSERWVCLLFVYTHFMVNFITIYHLTQQGHYPTVHSYRVQGLVAVAVAVEGV